MWFFKKQKNIVGIELDVTGITLSVITYQKEIYFLDAYQKYQFQDGELYNQRIFNSTRIVDVISQFMHEQKLANSTAVMCLPDSFVTEIITPEITPQIQQELAVYNWQSYQIIIAENPYLYIAALRHELFFQLQLLFNTVNLKVSTLTTKIMVLYYLFRKFMVCEAIEKAVNLDLNRETLRHYLQAHMVTNNLIKNFIFRTNKRFPELNQQEIMNILGIYQIGSAQMGFAQTNYAQIGSQQ